MSQINREQKKQLENEIRKIKNHIGQAESKISRLEKEIAILDEQLLDPDFYKSPESNEMLTSYNSLKQELETEMEKWGSLTEQLEPTEAKMREL